MGRQPSWAGTSWLVKREAEGTGARVCEAVAPASSSQPTWGQRPREVLAAQPRPLPPGSQRPHPPALHLLLSFRWWTEWSLLIKKILSSPS